MKIENIGFPTIFTIFSEKYFEGISYHGISYCGMINTIEEIFIKNGRNDKKLIFPIFTKKKNFDGISYYKKIENLANFSILNPESSILWNNDVTVSL